MWIFGYGSLIWFVDFKYEEKVPGYIDGYARKLWQGSTDHRGTPEQPGRVFTLVPHENSKVYGVCYRVNDDVKSSLDYREKDGYKLCTTQFHSHKSTEDVFEVCFYIAMPGNPSWRGDAPPDQLTDQIMEARGDSGHNVYYVLEFMNSYRTLAGDNRQMYDLQLEEIDRILREKLKSWPQEGVNLRKPTETYSPIEL